MKKLAPANPQPNTTMDTTEQIKAIATACGWTSCESIRGAVFGFPPGILDEGQFFDKSPPDYLSDLNACAEMEKTISNDGAKWNLYRMNLMRLCSQADEITDEISAPACLRCKAFLLTKGEWKP